jgi:hypothetical protein
MSRAKIVETRCDAGPVFSCVGCFTRHAHLMTNPKYNRLSLALALILNVLMVAGTPARAWSYRDRCAAASGNRNAARAICPMLGKPGPCCCASPGAAVGHLSVGRSVCFTAAAALWERRPPRRPPRRCPFAGASRWTTSRCCPFRPRPTSNSRPLDASSVSPPGRLDRPTPPLLLHVPRLLASLTGEQGWQRSAPVLLPVPGRCSGSRRA